MDKQSKTVKTEKPKESNKKHDDTAEKMLESNTATEEVTFDTLPSLPSKTYSDFRRTNPNAFVMFYAPWCSHCTNVKPVFAEASVIVPETTFATVDCTVEVALCSDAMVTAYVSSSFAHLV